jgi:hypothetical protein
MLATGSDPGRLIRTPVAGKATSSMNDHLDELKELATPGLADGETIVAALNVNYGGKINMNQAPTGLASLGHSDEAVVAGEQLAERLGDRPDVSFPSAKQMALVLTQTRMMCWSRGGFKSKPKAFIGEVPVEAMETITHESSRLGDRLLIKLYSGWEVNLESGLKDGGAEFAAQLTALVDPPSSF